MNLESQLLIGLVFSSNANRSLGTNREGSCMHAIFSSSLMQYFASSF